MNGGHNWLSVNKKQKVQGRLIVFLFYVLLQLSTILKVDGGWRLLLKISNCKVYVHASDT